jgi:hypothetical protein
MRRNRHVVVVVVVTPGSNVRLGSIIDASNFVGKLIKYFDSDNGSRAVPHNETAPRHSV